MIGNFHTHMTSNTHVNMSHVTVQSKYMGCEKSLVAQLANALHLLLFIYLFGLASQMQALAAGNF